MSKSFSQHVEQYDKVVTKSNALFNELVTRGEAVEAGLHFTKRMCCLSPPAVKKRLQ